MCQSIRRSGMICIDIWTETKLYSLKGMWEGKFEVWVIFNSLQFPLLGGQLCMCFMCINLHAYQHS